MIVADLTHRLECILQDIDGMDYLRLDQLLISMVGNLLKIQIAGQGHIEYDTYYYWLTEDGSYSSVEDAVAKMDGKEKLNLAFKMHRANYTIQHIARMLKLQDNEVSRYLRNMKLGKIAA